ncbi:hypothetical protein Tco_0115673 [Tanacetum coccineum]
MITLMQRNIMKTIVIEQGTKDPWGYTTTILDVYIDPVYTHTFLDAYNYVIPTKLSKNDQLRLDEELAFRLQAKEEEEERLAREKAQQIKEANTAWDDIQAKVEADYQLAQRLHDKEQEQYTDEEKAKFFLYRISIMERLNLFEMYV